MHHHRKALCASLLLALAIALAVGGLPAYANALYGIVFRPMWSEYQLPSKNAMFKGYAGMPISITREGPLATYGGAAESSAAEAVGHWEANPLQSGTFDIFYHEKDEYARFLVFGVPSVAPIDPTDPNLNWDAIWYKRYIKYQDSVTAFTWDPYPAGTWSQSFVAKGNCVTQVGIHQAIEFGPDVTVYITENDPSGPQIGPAKVIPTHIANPSSAYWSAGEVPTVPGRTYCANFFVANGLQVFLAGAGIQGGNPYPDGRVYKDGEPTTYRAIKCTIYQDTDGVISLVNTKKTNRGNLLLAYTSVTTLGQTFTAMGTSLLTFSALVGNSGGDMIATVYRSPGVDGEGVTQVGYSKRVKTIDYNTRSGCIWKSGEVPLTPGQSYYIKLKRADNLPFTIYYVSQNEYAGGQMYRDGVAMPNADMATTICSEESPGSAIRPQVAISGISVTRGVNTATITWNTDVATTTNYAEFSQDTPYTNRIDADSGGTTHSVTLTNLLPNTQYHYRVVGKVAGRFDCYSRDFVFCTNPDPNSPNLLTNSGFETGNTTGWTTFSIFNGAPSLRNYPWTSTGDPSYFSMQSRQGSGNYFLGNANMGSACKGGAYQRVAVTPGNELRLRAWVCSYQTDNVAGMFQFNSLGRVGIDPTGGTDPAAATVVWGPWVDAQDIYLAPIEGTGKGYWTEAFVKTIAASDHATAFFVGGSDAGMNFTVYGLDDAVLTQHEAPSVNHISEVAALPDGSQVRISDKIATAAASEVGANYIEEIDRSGGLRVESASDFPRDSRVTVLGTKGTKSTGEVYLYNAIMLSAQFDPTKLTMATVAKSIASKAGASNVALLMQVAGELVYSGGVYYVNDGSLPAPGLKLRTDPIWLLEPGRMYTVTGIVSMEPGSPDPTPILCPRDEFDLFPVGP